MATVGESARSHPVSGVPKTNLPPTLVTLYWHRTYAVVLMVRFITRKRHKASSAIGQRCMDEEIRDQAQVSWAFPAESPRVCWSLCQRSDRCMKWFPPGRLIRRLVLRGFLRGWSHRHLLPTQFQTCEKKQMLNINHIVPTNSVGTLSLSYPCGNSGNLLNVPCFLSPAKGPTLQRGLTGMAISRLPCWPKPPSYLYPHWLI